jgi:hypothetical protein
MTRYILQRLATPAAADIDLLLRHLVIIQRPAARRPMSPPGLVGLSISTDQIAALRHQYRLDQPSSSNTSCGWRTCSTATSACRWNTSAPTPT